MKQTFDFATFTLVDVPEEEEPEVDPGQKETATRKDLITQSLAGVFSNMKNIERQLKTFNDRLKGIEDFFNFMKEKAEEEETESKKMVESEITAMNRVARELSEFDSRFSKIEGALTALDARAKEAHDSVSKRVDNMHLDLLENVERLDPSKFEKEEQKKKAVEKKVAKPRKKPAAKKGK